MGKSFVPTAACIDTPTPLKHLTVAFALAISFSAHAAKPLGTGAVLHLDGQLGCPTFETQLALTNAVRAGATPTAQVAQDCKRLSGPFTVLKVRASPVGKVARVAFGKSSLWMLPTDPKIPSQPEVERQNALLVFGLDPLAEMDKLEKGDLRLLRLIKFNSTGEDFLSFTQRKRLRVHHDISDIACTEKQIRNLRAGCTISLQVSSGPVRQPYRCATLMRWHRKDKESRFEPDAGGARTADENLAAFFGAMHDFEQQCNR